MGDESERSSTIAEHMAACASTVLTKMALCLDTIEDGRVDTLHVTEDISGFHDCHVRALVALCASTLRDLGFTGDELRHQSPRIVAEYLTTSWSG